MYFGQTSALVALLALSACAHPGAISAIAAPNQPWKPPGDEAAPRAQELAALPPPPAIPAAGVAVDLPALVDLALRNDPRTRASWASAQQAAEAVGTARAGGLPQLDVGAVAGTQRSQFSPTLVVDRTDVGLTSNLTWLLFDSGGQPARVAAARDALLAADWTHDDTVQAVVFAVEQADYAYLGARAQVAASQASVDEAQRNLDAASARRDAGLGTIADVLTATTARSQAELALETAQGQADVLHGALASQIGLRPDADLDVGELPDTVDVQTADVHVEDLLAQAVAGRADLAAAAWNVAEARHDVVATRAEGLPSLSLSGGYSPTWYLAAPGSGASSAWSFGNNYTAALTLTVPVFDGLLVFHQTRAARAAVDVAQAHLDEVHRQVLLDAWTSAHAVHTAAQRVRTAHDLLASATQAEQASQERYAQGVGTLLELLTAQSALASARAQDAQARADFLVAVAELAHDTGGMPVPEGSK